MNGEPKYVFADAKERHEYDRLSLLQDECDPATFRHLDRLGVSTGWHCLEVGPGGGSVMRWLSRQVGPSGKVVAVDKAPRFLAGDSGGNLQVLQGDVTSPGTLPKAAFDLVHVRHLLLHVPERWRALANMAAALKPGGWLLAEEPDFVGGDEGGPVDAVFAATRMLYAGLGIDTSMGRKLPRLLDEAGLQHVGCESAIAVVNGGSRRAEIWRLAGEHLGDSLCERGGLDRYELNDFLKLTRDPKAWWMDYAVVSAWGRLGA